MWRHLHSRRIENAQHPKDVVNLLDRDGNRSSDGLVVGVQRQVPFFQIDFMDSPDDKLIGDGYGVHAVAQGGPF